MLAIVAVTSFAGAVTAQGRGKGGGNGGGGGGGGGEPPPPPAPAIAVESDGNLYVMNDDGSNITLVLAGAGRGGLLAPAWSPDGAMLLFAGDPEGVGTGVYAIGIDGSGLQRITDLNPGDDARAPVWSPVPAPDGSYRIAFTAIPLGVPTASSEVFVVRPDGTGRQQVTATSARYEEGLAWSPDGSALAVTYLIQSECAVLQLASDGNGGLMVSGRASLTDLPGSPFQGLGINAIAWPAWSHDGTRILVGAAVPGGNGWDLFAIPLVDPGNPFWVTASANSPCLEPSWSPDDSMIVYRMSGRRKKVGIYTIGADGTGLTQLVTGGHEPDWRPVVQ